ncbi:Na+:solute symporter, partial [Haladaptatus sp. W1]|uniref:sodium:solute symporter family protein n=1 Tax=Haladaptatus sp. W1 TaxID=1897478 RepID=UPI000849BD4D
YFVVHRVRALDEITFPDIVANITGREWARPVTAVPLLANAWIYLIMQLVGASLLVTTITGVPYKYMIWVIGFVFIVYTVLGGMVSVAWTDLLQGTVMVATVLAALVYMTVTQGGLTAINTEFATMGTGNVAPLGAGAYTLIGLVGSLIAFFGTIFTGQNYIIRINATRDIKTAKFHLAASGVILSVFYAALVLLGGATTVALNGSGLGVDNVDKAFPVLITEYLPTGVGIVIILAVMSAILSTTDTRLHSAGITTAHDLYSYFRPNASDEKLLSVSRLSTIFWGFTATAVAMNPPGTIITLYEFRAILLTSAFLIPIYVALYWRGLSGRAIVSSIIGGTIMGVGWELGGPFFGIPSVLIGIGAALICIVVGHYVWQDESTPRADPV